MDIDEITVNLTPFGSPQNLYVEDIKWGKQVVIKNADGGPVNCFYHIWAPRLGELHVEYEGQSELIILENRMSILSVDTTTIGGTDGNRTYR